MHCPCCCLARLPNLRARAKTTGALADDRPKVIHKVRTPNTINIHPNLGHPPPLQTRLVAEFQFHLTERLGDDAARADNGSAVGVPESRTNVASAPERLVSLQRHVGWAISLLQRDDGNL